MKKSSGVNYSRTVAKRNRRERVIDMLEEQLKFGFKTLKDQSVEKLADKDIVRIKKEIETLKTRV